MKAIDSAMNNKIENLWTIDDVANFCRVKATTVKYWVRNAEIPFIKLGKQIRFNANDIREWIDRKGNGLEKWRSQLEKIS